MINYRNAKYINDSGWIDCEIEHPQHGWIPYTLDPNDHDMTINNDELLAIMAKRNDVAAYVPPTQAELDEAAATQVRTERDFKLQTEVDPIAGNSLRWSSLTRDQQEDWANYRQALLDITSQPGFPHDVTWPNKPPEA